MRQKDPSCSTHVEQVSGADGYIGVGVIKDGLGRLEVT